MKKVKILRTALEDLKEGREFYNFQSPGIGEYFLDTLFTHFGWICLIVVNIKARTPNLFPVLLPSFEQLFSI